MFQDAAAVGGGQQPTPVPVTTPLTSLNELSQSDLTSLVTGLQGSDHEEDVHMGDTDDIFKQLGDTAFELEHLFNEFGAGAAHEVKVNTSGEEKMM